MIPFLIAIQTFVDSKSTLRRGTCEYYAYIGKSLILAATIAGLLDRDITTLQIRDLTTITLIIDNPVHFPGISDCTRQKLVKGIKTMFNWFLEAGWITSNPAVTLKFRKIHSQPTQPFKPEEVQALLRTKPRTASEFRDGCLFRVFTDTGIRCEEARNLRLEDWKGDRLMVTNGKGGKPRILSLGQATIANLQEYVQNARPKGGEDFLFLTEKGRRLSAGMVAKRLDHWAERAGVRDAAPHRFRATFATRFILKGGDIITLQTLLGHSTLDMTRRYIHLALAEEACLTNQVNSLVDELLEVPVAKSEASSTLLTTAPVQIDERNALLMRLIEQNNALIAALMSNGASLPSLGITGTNVPEPLREARVSAGDLVSNIRPSYPLRINERRQCHRPYHPR
jgi:site-specific recombinase XerD